MSTRHACPSTSRFNDTPRERTVRVPWHHVEVALEAADGPDDLGHGSLAADEHSAREVARRPEVAAEEK
jgi:hypothetical protein